MPLTRQTLILTQRDVERLVDMPMALRVVRRACVSQARGEATMPPKIYLPLPNHSDFRAMPAALTRPPCCGIKWVNVHLGNRAKGLPTVMGTVILNDPRTGVPLAVMDGMAITRWRTGAAAGVAARALARSASSVVGLVGCGAQAWYQLLALAMVFRLSEVRVWGYQPGEASRFVARAQPRLPAVRLRSVQTVRECVHEADLIVTVTSSRRPLVERVWVQPGAHINAIGADAPGKQELDPRILRTAIVVVDDREQAIHTGEINVPIRKKQFSPRAIHATLGEVLIGTRPGRTNMKDVTVFDSTGLAIHDIALGYELFRKARRRRMGRSVRLFYE